MFHLKCAFLLAALFIPVLAHAENVYVEPATGTATSADDLAATTDIIRSSVTEVSSDHLVGAPSQADISLRPKLVRLGQAYVLTLGKVKNGEIIFSSQLKAMRMDEMDKVAERLTRSVLVGEQAQSHPRVGELTLKESKEGAERRPTHNAWYLGFGGSELNHLNSSGLGYSLGLAYSWDVNFARVKLFAEGDGIGDAFFAGGGMGFNYYFSQEDIAPYLSADFGAGAAKIDGGGITSGQIVGGFIVGAGAGIEFLRTTAVNVGLGFRAGFLLHENNIGLPEVLSLRLGVYFK
ncbi:MAG: hypothetical protein P4M08_01095 [Oligoflexia bacterium]|nr:hypothetical protein [Oligoflexia bacterium]